MYGPGAQNGFSRPALYGQELRPYGAGLENGYPIVPSYGYPGANLNGFNRGFYGGNALNRGYGGLNPAQIQSYGLQYGLNGYGRPIGGLNGYGHGLVLPNSVGYQAGLNGLSGAQRGLGGLAYGVNGRADGLFGNRYAPYGIPYNK